MCGRYTVFSEKEAIEIRAIIEEVNRRYYKVNVKTDDIYPTNIAPILASNGVHPMKWGYPNYQSKQPIINARSETVQEKRTFKEAFQSRRCIVPTTGFYEWSVIEGQKKKQKNLFNLPDSNMLYLAGIFSMYELDGEKFPHFVILTTSANESMQPIHHRMPVIVEQSDIRNWICDTQFAEHMISRIPERLVHRLV